MPHSLDRETDAASGTPPVLYSMIKTKVPELRCYGYMRGICGHKVTKENSLSKGDFPPVLLGFERACIKRLLVYFCDSCSLRNSVLLIPDNEQGIV